MTLFFHPDWQKLKIDTIKCYTIYMKTIIYCYLISYTYFIYTYTEKSLAKVKHQL